ncbi:MAG: type II secretion system protein N [Pseudomonadota bacterium]
MKHIWQWLPNLNAADLLSRAARYRTGAVLIVITILTYQCTGIFYRATSLKMIHIGATTSAMPQTTTAPVTTAEPVDFYKVIPDRNLFGTTDKTLAEKRTGSETTAGRPDIAQILELRGTVAGDAKYGFAVIENKAEKKQQLYKVGDNVSGARVVRIMRNAIALKVNNQEQILKVPETSENSILPPESPTGPSPLASSGKTIAIDRKEIDSSLKDMGTILSQAVVRPYFTNSVPDGFIISSIKNGSIYQKIGLMDGDVIQGVNNRKLTSGDDMVELYHSFKSGSDIALQVNRHGRQEIFNYTFR